MTGVKILFDGRVRVHDSRFIKAERMTIKHRVFAELEAHPGKSPDAIVTEKGWKVERDEGAVKKAIDDVIAGNADLVEKYRSGKTKVLGALVGALMKATAGKIDPKDANRLLVDALDAPKPP